MNGTAVALFLAAVIAGVQALFWIAQGLDDRRWQFIGDQGRYAFRMAWLNMAASAACSFVGGVAA